MPLKGKFEWEEKRDHFVVRVPLKGVAPAKVDIVATKSTVKVNYSPYLVDVVLHGEINPLRHKATVKNGVLNIQLFKVAPGMWGKFDIQESDVPCAVERRAEAASAQAELEKQLGEKRRDRKSQDERFSTRKQMALEEAERTRLEDLKQEEKEQAEEEMYAAFAKQEQERLAAERKQPHKTPHVPSGVGAPRPLPAHTDVSAPITNAYKRFEDIDSDLEDDDDIKDKAEALVKTQEIDLNEPIGADDEDDSDMKYIPPPRSAGVNTVGITYTPRIFPTPMRSSTAAREEDWIAQNRKHLKKHGVFGKNLAAIGKDVTEEDPAWLKAKGDDFYRNGDYRSAINAYSAAIDADETMAACFANRSACYFKLGMDRDCKDDCTEALKLLDEQRLEQNNDNLAKTLAGNVMMVKLLLRRGIVMCRLGMLAEALQDYTHGKEILSSNADVLIPGITVEQVSEDVQQLEKIVYADEKKKEADVSFGQRDLVRAVALYSEVLELIPEHVGCLANRSACKIALGDFEGCIQDCDIAVHYLQSDQKKLGEISGSTITSISDSSLSMLYAVIPPPGSEKRNNWLMKTVVRRGAVLAQLGNLDAAIRDYGLALSIEPTNTDLQTDLQNLVNTRSKRAQQGIDAVIPVIEQSVQ